MYTNNIYRFQDRFNGIKNNRLHEIAKKHGFWGSLTPLIRDPKKIQNNFFLKNLILAGPENKISAKFIVKPINDTVVNIGQKSTKIHQKIENMVKKRAKNETGHFEQDYATVSQKTYIQTKYINMKKFGDIKQKKFLNLPHSYLTGLLNTKLGEH